MSKIGSVLFVLLDLAVLALAFVVVKTTLGI